MHYYDMILNGFSLCCHVYACEKLSVTENETNWLFVGLETKRNTWITWAE